MKDFMIDFEEYIRQCEPDKKEKSQNWQTAIGLQQVDGLKPSAYLIKYAIQNIEGKINIDEVQYHIDSYYKTKTVMPDDDEKRLLENFKIGSVRNAPISVGSFTT